jgi:hypothetical protein
MKVVIIIHINNKKSEEKDKEEKRDPDLENIVGNLLISEYQVDKLRSRLTDAFSSYRLTAASTNNKTSGYIYRYNNKWYKISARIDETYASNC